MGVIGVSERHMDRGLALTLPSLVAVSCLVPLVGLLLRPLSSWAGPGVVCGGRGGVLVPASWKLPPRALDRGAVRNQAVRRGGLR